MSELLDLAMRAHGGLERWKQVRNMQAKVTLTVPFGGSKAGLTDCLAW